MSEKSILFLTSNNGKVKEFQSFFETSDYKVSSLKELDFSFEGEALENSEYFISNGIIKFLQGAHSLKRDHPKTFHALAVDDSGLCIPDFDFEPGVHSAYYGGPSKKNIEALIKRIEENSLFATEYKEEKRFPAFFVTFLIFAWLNDIYLVPKSFKTDAKSLSQQSLILLENEILMKIKSEKKKERGFSLRKELKYYHEKQNFHAKLQVFVGASYGYVSNRDQQSGNGFGYDPIFYSYKSPEKSYAEMSVAEKNSISHRGLALKELKDFLTSVT